MQGDGMFKVIGGVVIAWMIVYIAILTAAVWVAWHFLSKVW